MNSGARRKIYIVMSSKSERYAVPCLRSLLRNAMEPLDVLVLTDFEQDRNILLNAMVPLAEGTKHTVDVKDVADADRRAEEFYREFPAIAEFRKGHPCWRKITDPIMYAKDGEEVIVLDPDVYFPNRFVFEPTPDTGILLMWQGPNCLLPEEAVRKTFENGLRLADHTDIGVCQFKTPFPLDQLEDVISNVDYADHTRSMHIESIVWAALAVKMGGAHFNPDVWHCFANTPARRIMRRLGQSGVSTFNSLRFSKMKAFHAGGVAKNWLVDAEKAGLFDNIMEHDRATKTMPYAEYSRKKFESKFRLRRLAKKLGLYSLMAN